MARPARLSVGGELHCVLQSGHNRQAVFVDDVDRIAYLGMLRDAARQYGVAVHAHALLDNEVHLLLTPADALSIGRLMQSLGRRYVAAVNRRHGRSGTLWAGRFRSALIDGDALGIEAIVHVETRPLDAGLAASASDWAWSSAGHHLGRQRDPLITEHSSYWRLGNTPFERELAHAHKLVLGNGDVLREQFLRAVRQSLVVGPQPFAKGIGQLRTTLPERRSRGRPRLAFRADKKTVPN